MFRWILAGLALFAVVLLFNALPVEASHAGHWHYGSGPGSWGWLGFLVWPFRWIVWFGLMMLVVLLLLRVFGLIGRKSDGDATQVQAPPADTAPGTTEALDILKRRFAEGEIDARQFESMKARLSEA